LCTQAHLGKKHPKQENMLILLFFRVAGTHISSYRVSDRTQVAEFNIHTWLSENPQGEEEESVPCPVCQLADREDVLLLCDVCDTPYHTHCIGLPGVPSGHWYCMECVDRHGAVIEERVQDQTLIDGQGSEDGNQQSDIDDEESPENYSSHSEGRRSYFFPRTRASMRRAQRRAHSDEWQGAWGQISGRVFNAINLDLDLDYQDNDDEILETAAWQGYRRSQHIRQRELHEHRLWQQRLSIASRLGAGDVFETHIPHVANRRVIPAHQPPRLETREERKAWRALERARDGDDSSTPNNRKRKSRSPTAEPAAPEEPERKLKRPRTRRIPAQNGESSSSSASHPAPSTSQTSRRGSGSNARSPGSGNAAPSFLASLLREVEMSTQPDGENDRNLVVPFAGGYEAPSSATSPPGSGHNSPRASSITPPPNPRSPKLGGRPSSPVSTLSSHIEPVYFRANYSPSGSSSKSSPTRQVAAQQQSSSSMVETEHRVRPNPSFELRQPKPRRTQPISLNTSDATPVTVKSPLPLDMKESISQVVRGALRPHWKSSKLTTEQYVSINRDVSRKLYEVTDPASVSDEIKQGWEKIAAQEVNRALSELKV
jgi:hypothetical protein